MIGNPLGLSLTLTTGIVSSKRTLGDTDLLQLSAGISPGSSGSPVFNRRGEVVGMVVSTLAAGQQLNFAVSSKDLKSGSVWGVPLTLACSLIQPESEGLLTVSALAFDSSRQDDLLRHEAGGYDGLQQVSVFVEPLPSELQEVTSREELQSWVSDTLRAANLNVVSREQQRDSIRKGSIPKTEREKLTQDDRYCSCIYVNLNAIKTLDHHVVLNCDVEVRRAGVILPGGDTSTITTDLVSCIGSFGDLYADKKGYLRQT